MQPSNRVRPVKENEEAEGISLDDDEFDEVLDTAFHNDKKNMR